MLCLPAPKKGITNHSLLFPSFVPSSQTLPQAQSPTVVQTSTEWLSFHSLPLKHTAELPFKGDIGYCLYFLELGKMTSYFSYIGLPNDIFSAFTHNPYPRNLDLQCLQLLPPETDTFVITDHYKPVMGLWWAQPVMSIGAVNLWHCIMMSLQDTSWRKEQSIHSHTPFFFLWRF